MTMDNRHIFASRAEERHATNEYRRRANEALERATKWKDLALRNKRSENFAAAILCAQNYRRNAADARRYRALANSFRV
jgi:hypothetical protein